ncbi:recombinase zinc beta ribbon domain-containing protein [Rhizobium rhizogenes]|uniref:recombinase zinc beta ribbon domain-containing protein n=1 Tax=Rhizobium rhizogenes TaxID=359 RepID=UPI002110CE62|nr:recombinase zinc beta ribbon domain-containing protein [Rhizobium rhizogenes]MDJ1632316.1 recombinase zinc beta ribbon domain-containing protein [Rhizobium rhizogenes]
MTRRNRCGGTMTIGTGTSHTGKVHRYYCCVSFMKKGPVACEGQKIPMDSLDELVTDYLTQRLFTGERLQQIIAEVSSKRAIKAKEVDVRASGLLKQVTEYEARLKRLYDSIEQGWRSY